MTLEIGTVLKWDNFPLRRYGGELKPRWFIYIGETGLLSQITIIYLATTTTQVDHFQAGGSRSGHNKFTFKTQEFQEFEEDCILDYEERPYDIKKERFLKNQGDISVKGKLKEETMRMIYNLFLRSGSCSNIMMLDIHDSFNKAGITGLKRPK